MLKLDKRRAEWDLKREEQPLMTPDVGSRERPGVRKSVRMSRHKFVYCLVDPHYFRSDEKPPYETQSALEDVFGERAKDLKLALHPHMKRWCLYQRVWFPDKGENLWQVVSVFSEDPDPAKMPADFQDDLTLMHFHDVIGEYRLPTKQDFECIERADKKKYGVDSVTEYLNAASIKEDEDKEKEFEEFRQDFAEYHNWAFTNYANQLYGSGERMQSVPTVIPHTNPERWTIVKLPSKGYSTKVRKGSRWDKMWQLLSAKRDAGEIKATNEQLVDLIDEFTAQKFLMDEKKRKQHQQEQLELFILPEEATKIVEELNKEQEQEETEERGVAVLV